MHLKALFEMWIVTIQQDGYTDFVAVLGSQKPELLKPYEGGTFYHLQEGYTVNFTNEHPDQLDPYQVVMEKYPLFFELEPVPTD